MPKTQTITFAGDDVEIAVDNGDGTGCAWSLHGAQLDKHAEFKPAVQALVPAEQAKAAALTAKFKA